MSRIYKLLAERPHPANPLNLSTVIEVTDSDTGEVLVLTDRVFASDLTADTLAQQLGVIEANVLAGRAAARATLAAKVGQRIEPIAPIAVDPLQAAYDIAVRKLAELDRLVMLKVITASDKEYTDAVDAAKAAKVAIEPSKGK